MTKQEMLKEIRDKVINYDDYWADVVWALVDDGYRIEYVDSQIEKINQWFEETLYVYYFEKNGKSMNVGILIEEILVENEEDIITKEVFEVTSGEKIITIWKRKE